MPHGFLRAAACSPELRVADPAFNAARTLDQLRRADDVGADLAVFPECGLTGYTCHDLFHQPTLIRAAEDALAGVLADDVFRGIAVIGLPVHLDGRLFNAAAVIGRGRLLGVVPKTYLPNYREFYDARYFAPAAAAVTNTLTLAGQTVPFGTDLLFEADGPDGFVLGVEICEDLWTPVPPSSLMAIGGATVIANPSASNELIGKAAYRRQLVAGQSGRCLAGYVYAASGVGESTTDLVFGGHSLIAENGTILGETPRFSRTGGHVVADIDLGRLAHERVVTGTFAEGGRLPGLLRPYRRVKFAEPPREARTPELIRFVDPHPFVPSDPATLGERCDEIFRTQVAGLAKRLEHVGRPAPAIGVSGGLDSTLALLVLCKTMDVLGEPRSRVRALTMPGFGTTGRTLGNARKLMAQLGVSAREIDIRTMCIDQMRAIGHAPFGVPLAGLDADDLAAKLRELRPEQVHDLTFENVQARARTSLLMNSGFVIGTGDLSELALGWCTYNADHMSMYNPNVSIPKSLVRFLVTWAANHEFADDTRLTLLDVAATEISPELLPTRDDAAPQSTEGTVGPYELHDFFLYHFLRTAAPPDKILFLAKHAKFDRNYSPAEVKKWLRVFVTRFFANQFKRSCMPDGPKVGTVSLSPRGDWRMPSDAAGTAWLARLG
ncbi:MAG: NAD(+) synthase [Fimbriiglobus sp.]